MLYLYFDILFLIAVYGFVCYVLDMCFKDAAPMFQALYGIDFRYYNYLKPEFVCIRFETCNVVASMIVWVLFITYPLTKLLIYVVFFFYFETSAFVLIASRVLAIRLILSIDLELTPREWVQVNIYEIYNMAVFLLSGSPSIGAFVLVTGIPDLETFVDRLLNNYKRLFSGEINSTIMDIKLFLFNKRMLLNWVQIVGMTVLLAYHVLFDTVDSVFELIFVYYCTFSIYMLYIQVVN